MKLASLSRGRDGVLAVVDRELTRCTAVPGIASTLQHALDTWIVSKPQLQEVYERLNANEVSGARKFVPEQVRAPLPRAFHWVDGSAYVNHVELVRKARGAEMPPSYWSDPLLYQGGSDDFTGPHAPIEVADEAWGIDFEAEVAVVTDDVPMGTSEQAASDHIVLLALLNDVTLRHLVPGELAKGFGFYQSKPATAFAPVVVTPDELGDAWRDCRIHLPLVTVFNGELFGQPNAGVDMTFNFAQLLAHAARTRRLGAGTVVGSGTVSNVDRSVGSSCLAERRTLETLEHGEPRTPFMRFGDRVRIEMKDARVKSVFGAIEQTVEQYAGP